MTKAEMERLRDTINATAGYEAEYASETVDGLTLHVKRFVDGAQAEIHSKVEWQQFQAAPVQLRLPTAK